MTNREKYNFSDFTYQGYRDCLSRIKKHHRPIFYQEIRKSESNPTVLWRHDVDYSLYNSLHLGKIEFELGVKATYFLWMHSEYYNVMDIESKRIIEELIGMGHQIGLHFDPAYYNISDQQALDNKIRQESNCLEELFGQQLYVFSFHNTTKFILSCKEESYGGLINAYSTDIFNKFHYCSDSNGIWKYERLSDFIDKRPTSSLQILTHPVWWVERPISPHDRIMNELNYRKTRTEQIIQRELEKFNTSYIKEE